MNRLVPVRKGLIAPILTCFVFGMCGCAVKTKPAGRFTAEPPPKFSEGGNVPAPNEWWITFEDDGLNQQVEQMFSGSFTLAAAIQRINASRALARRQASDLLPDVNIVASGSHTFGPGPDTKSYVWGLDSSYPVDLWGRIESYVQAAQLRASATQADYQAIALALTADVAGTWFSLIEAHAQLALLENQIETNQMGLMRQEASFGLGQVRLPDVLRQRQLVESTLEQSVVVKSRIEVLEHQMAILLGQLPQQATYATGRKLPELPPMPATGLPAELLKRRPDVRRDYLAFMAADRDLASAISDQFPRLNLTGSLLNSARRSEDLFRDWFVSIGAQLVGPLFDGGQRRAEIARTGAVVRQRFNEYGDTMLNAFREVEDSLAQEKYQIERLKHLRAQSKFADQAAELLLEQYYIGDADYLDVLSAITAEQRLQRETLTAQLELLLIRVSLYLALAGGFDSQPTVTVEIEDLPQGESLNVVPALDAAELLAPDQEPQPGPPDNSGDFEQLLKTVERLPEIDLDE
ncbi:TolC family protein [Rhodopirellula sp. MGV]|uniref:TolC family protein n=1 Tax=Rhodopirellula sp. MGV TaxID=2023130 RepID=UPI000B9635A5|nr:TolC family protein [Rhodopirellula sp. MGV]OYP35167.1 hypothetical protein CGZ80_12265 [Rhodopirellula sp. MGV]PNY37818.1 TolC family protein [Rhodopirellula baltica]